MKTYSYFLKSIQVFLFIIFTSNTFSQRNDCDNNAAGELTVNSSCTPITFDSSNNTNYWDGATGCNSGDNDDAWGWFIATSTSTTVTYQPAANRDAILHLFTGACSTAMTSLSCSDLGGDGVAETITYATTIGTRYRVRIQRSGSNNSMTGTICVYSSAPPSGNFTCATATSLPCATTNLAGTTVGSSNIAHGSGCTMSNYGAWYTFVGDGQITTISSTAGSGYDHEMSISSGSCGTLSNITCQDSGLSGGIETFTFTTTNGTTYYVYIADYSSGSSTTGTFTISRTCTAPPPPPANDLCINATSLPCGTTNLAGTTVGATDKTHATGCTMSNYGVWYTFVGDGNTTTITTNPSYNIKLSVASGSCGTFTNVACTDTSPETASFSTTNGVNYYVYVAGSTSGSTTTGTFTISRTCSAALTNDNCNTAIPLTINTSCSYSTYTTIGATASTSPSTPPAPGCASYNGGDVWFSFVVPANGEVTVDTQTGGITDSGMAWYSGTCGALTLIECDDDDSANGAMSTITRTGLTPGATIYVRVWEYNNDAPGTFGICATSPGPCTAPVAQASGFTAGTITSTTFPATFSGTANGYLVIQSTSATPPSQPVNGTVYNAGNIATLGAGLTYVQSGASTSIAGTGLTGNTRYYYYIYAYNNTNCYGGPIYNAAAALSGTAVTCPATPTSVSTSSTTSSFSINWASSLGGASNAVSYQIQVTTDAGYTANVAGSPFTVNDPTTTLNVTGLAANTTYYYRVRAFNGCYSSYATGTATTGYCVPAPSSVDGTGITNVTMGTINNTTGAEAGNYGNYSAQITNGQQGETISFSIRFSTSGFSYETIIWIDWNNDLDFNDAGEAVFTGTSTSATPSMLTGSFQIPANATLGNHRIRIGGLDSGTPTPCYTGSYGTYEDYTVNVTAATCPGPSNVVVTILTQTTANVTWSAGSPAPASGYQYYLTTSATAPIAGTTPTGSVGAGVTTVALSGLISNTTYYFWVRSNCGGSQGFWIGPNTFTMPNCLIGNSMGTSSLGCPNVISGGLGLNGGDPLPFNCTAASTCVDLEAKYLDLGNTSTYTVEEITYAPPYQFACLKNPVSVNTDDIWSPVINLPFDFCFYGNTYNQCLIGSNGVITFDLTNNSAGGTCDWEFDSSNPGQLPISGHSSLIENAIFGVFHDIDPRYGGEVGWELITLNSGCRALVASWSDIPMYDENSILYTGMMVLYENTNVIEVYVEEKNIDNFGAGTWNDGNAIIGIQNANGTQAVVPTGYNANDTNWTATNKAWRFVPAGSSITTIKWYEGSGTSGPIIATTDNVNVCPAATTTYTAEITYTLCDGRTIKELDETTVTVNGAKVWNGSVSTNWNVANNWTPSGVPVASDCVVIADTTNDPIISGASYNGLGLNLTVNNNANLTITTNNSLTITNWVNINTSGDLILQNSASLIQTNNDANQGTMHMSRTANIRKLDYVYWSSPAANFSINNVSPGTTGNKYKWTPTIPTNTNGFGNWVGANENMVAGKGYIVRGPDSFTTTLAPFTAVFAGTPNNGIITTPIQRGTWNGGAYATGVSSTPGTNNDDNWNLVGNPYPSAVRAIDFLTLNTNIAGFINVWTHGTLPTSAIADPFYNNYVYNYTPGDYITYNSSGASAGPGTFGGYIGAGQGFFVLMNHTSASSSENVTFNNSMRSSTYDNSQFFRTSDDSGRIWLDIIAPDASVVRNLVAYVDGATNNLDRLYDAITDEKLSLNLYSAIGDEFMKIQGRTLPFDENDRVPMGIKVAQDGNYSIGIGILDGFFTNENQSIYLEDKVTNVIHNLKQNPYSFTATAGNYPNRFVLRYTNETLGNDDIITDDANLWVISSEELSVKSTKNEIQSVKVFDVLGRELAYYSKVNSYEVPLSKIQKNNAGLIIQVTLSNGTIVSKKAIY